MLKTLSVIILVLLLGPSELWAQSGKNEIQLAAQLSLPTGDLEKVAKQGHGLSVKGLWGIGSHMQQFTAEIGYSYFEIKDKYLVNGENAYYGGFTLYGGYRYSFQNFFVEPQAGVAFYKIDAFTTENYVGIQQRNAYFDWAAGIGYTLKQWELAVRYQNAQVSNSPDVTFIALRLGFKFGI